MPLSLTEKVKYYHYEASKIDLLRGALGQFVQEIHSNPEYAAEVKSVKFTQPADEIGNSGLVELLGPLVPADSGNPPSTAYPPLVEAALRLRSLQRQFNTPPNDALDASRLAEVPHKFVLEMYVNLLASMCSNIEVMEFPEAWDAHLGRVKVNWGQKLEWTEKERGQGFVRYGRAVKGGRFGA